MVTASKVQQGRPVQQYASPAYQAVGQSEALHVGTEPSSWPHARVAEDTDSPGAGSLREFFPGVRHGTSVAESTESYSNAPLCFGEQLVLETYMRHKGRRYDRQRQDELSQPRRHKVDAWAFGAQGGEVMEEKVLDKHEVTNLVARLAKPKRHQSNEDAGQMVMMHFMRDEASKRQSAADAEALVKRLAAPKTFRSYDPTPGERVCMMYNRWKPTRAVNLDRLADMAKPKKRGGRAESWGVSGSRSMRLEGSVSLTSTPRDHSSMMHQLPPAPVSARQGPSSPGAGQDPPRPTETSRIERLPEVADDYSYPRTIDTNRSARSPEEPDLAPSSRREADPSKRSAATSSTVAAAAENWKPVESRPPVAQGLFKPMQPVDSRPAVVQGRRAGEPQESHWPSSGPREAEADEPGMSFLNRTARSSQATWRTRLQGVAPSVDANGFLSGFWGEAMVEAIVLEYTGEVHDGPVGEVIDFLIESGYGRFMNAASMLESRSQYAMDSGGFSTRAPGDPEAWAARQALKPLSGASRSLREGQGQESNNDEDDDYESDDPVSYRPAALQSNSLRRPQAGAVASSAPAQPVQSSYPSTLQQGTEEEEESEDGDEPFFPQFGFAGQRTGR